MKVIAIALLSIAVTFLFDFTTCFNIRTRLSMASDSGLAGIGKIPEDELPDDAFGAPVGPLPTVSSSINFGEIYVDESKLVDLWVVGAGCLGSAVVKQWVDNKLGTVVAETRSVSRHEELRSLGGIPRLRSERSENGDVLCARNVLVCVPPSAHPDGQEYAEELFRASRLWAGKSYGGFVFTSSTAVYGESNGNTVTEDFRVDTRSKRSTRLLAVEEEVLHRGGSVMRLAGLYTATRGPHTMWLKAGAVDSHPDGVLNMLHYEDAASAAIKALQSRLTGTIFLASDDEPVTRENICKAALESNLFPGAKMPTFAQETGPRGKICDCSKTKKTIGWQPKYPSFQEYMYNLGGKSFKRPKTREEKMNLLWLPGSDDDDLLTF